MTLMTTLLSFINDMLPLSFLSYLENAENMFHKYD